MVRSARTTDASPDHVADAWVDRLSVTARQCFGAACVERWCRATNVDHPAVRRLIEDAWDVARLDRVGWDAWADAITDHPIRDGGDSQGRALQAEAAPPRWRQDLGPLLDALVETSMATWYASDLPGSARALRALLRIVRRAGVMPPDPMPFLAHAPGANGWGRSLSDEEIAAWRALA